MIISGNIKKRKAIILSSQRIIDLDSIIMQNCERIEYAAVTSADTRISFENIDELLAYDNFKSRRITGLEIIGYQKYNRIITMYIGDWDILSFTNYGTPIRCNYQLPSVNAETLFLHAFEEWYAKSVADYWLLGKFSMSSLICMPGAFVWLFWSIFGRPDMNINYDNTLLIAAMAIVVVFCFVTVKLVKYIDTHFFSNLFPAAAFLWGEEIQRYEKWGSLRNNLLWGGIFAILIGLTVNFLYELLKG